MKRTIVEIVAKRLGAEVDEAGFSDIFGIDVVDLGWEDEDLHYPVPAVVSPDDAFAFEAQLKDLVEHERIFRKKWLRG